MLLSTGLRSVCDTLYLIQQLIISKPCIWKQNFILRRKTTPPFSGIISLDENLTCLFLECNIKRYHMTPKKYLLPFYDPYSVHLWNIHNSLTNKLGTSLLKLFYINNYLKHVSANHYIHNSYKFGPKHVAGHCVCTLLVLILYILVHLLLVVEPARSLERAKAVHPYICVGCTTIFSVSSRHLMWGRPSALVPYGWVSISFLQGSLCCLYKHIPATLILLASNSRQTLGRLIFPIKFSHQIRKYFLSLLRNSQSSQPFFSRL